MLVRQILFLASRGFIDKVLYCQITDKGLQNHYGDTIVIESQKGQGQSNIAFSSSISVIGAIRAASKLKADLKFSEVEASFVDIPGMQEDQILHDAAKVLRGSLHAVEISKDFYPSPSDLSHHKSLQFVPPSLMTFLSWLVDDNCFHIESDYNALSHDKASSRNDDIVAQKQLHSI